MCDITFSHVIFSFVEIRFGVQNTRKATQQWELVHNTDSLPDGHFCDSTVSQRSISDWPQHVLSDSATLQVVKLTTC